MATPTIPEGTLMWDSYNDWVNANERVGVITQDYGNRSRQQIELGIDPDDTNIADEALHYWPLEEDPTQVQTVTDVINGVTGTYRGDPARAQDQRHGSGMHGYAAPVMDGNDSAITIDSDAEFDHGGEFAFFCVFDTEEDRNLRTIFHTGDWGTEGSILISKNDNGRIGALFYANGEWHGHGNFHPGQATTEEPHTLFVSLSEGGGEWTLNITIDLDHVFLDTNVERPALSPSDQDATLNAFWPSNNRFMSGLIDDVMYWDHHITREEAGYIITSYHEGWLYPAWKQSEHVATELDIDADVPPDTRLRVNVVQDVSGDLTNYNEQTIQISDDQSSYPLSNFDPVDARWRADMTLETDDPYATPTVRSVSLDMFSFASAGVWDTHEDDGVVLTDAGTILTV